MRNDHLAPVTSLSSPLYQVDPTRFTFSHQLTDGPHLPSPTSSQPHLSLPTVSSAPAAARSDLPFCRLLSAIREVVLLMLAVVGLCCLPLDDVGGGLGSGEGPQPEEVME